VARHPFIVRKSSAYPVRERVVSIHRAAEKECVLGSSEGMGARERAGAALRPSPSRLFYPLFDSSYIQP
jgi:hypothetical protein